MKNYSLLIAVMVLAGCAARPTVSENQCRAGDWQTIGYRDGSTGVASTRLLSHQEACGEFGIIPDRTGYLAGWSAGLETYCTTDNGFQLGQRGGSLNTVCSAELREPFASAYADGYNLYSARREVNRLSQQLISRGNRMEQLTEEIIIVTTAQIQPHLSVEDRLLLVARLKNLIEERATIETELPAIDQDLLVAENQLARLNQTYAVR